MKAAPVATLPSSPESAIMRPSPRPPARPHHGDYATTSPYPRACSHPLHARRSLICLICPPHPSPPVPYQLRLLTRPLPSRPR